MAEHEGQQQRAQRAPATATAGAPELDAAGAPANPLLARQQTIGNQAVQREIQGGALPTRVVLGQHGTLGNQAVQRLLRAQAVQAKLTVNAPDDAYEQEADAVADSVMRMPEPDAAPTRLQRRPAGEPVTAVQAAAEPGGAAAVSPELEGRIARLAGGGQPLPESERAFFEPRFGADFSGVRVHADGEAADLSRSVEARAFTVGQDVAFAAGEYAPGTDAGRRLMAHELTHTIQQGGGQVQRAIIQRQETQEITFSEEEAGVVGGPNILPDIDYFVSRIQLYLQHVRDSNQEACQVFANTIFHETEETAQPDILSAVLKKGAELAKDAIVDQLAARVPGVDIVVGLIEAALTEVDRANRARREVAAVTFINDHILDIGQALQQVSERLAADETRQQLYLEIHDQGRAEAFARDSRQSVNSLRAPSNNQILRAMTEAYMRQNQSVRTEHGILGLDTYASGVLYLKYIVNEQETEARLVEKKLISPYASQVKALLRRTIGDRIDTGALNFMRIVRLEREDVRVMAEVHRVRAGVEGPDDRGLHYFTRLVRDMPTLPLSAIEATERAAIID